MLGSTCGILRRPVSRICAAAVLCAGCVPVPNTATLSPPIVGTIHDAERVPLAGRHLAVSVEGDADTCERPVYMTVSDSTGAFALPPVTRREPFTVVLFDRLLCYSVCEAGSSEPLRRRCHLHRVPPADTLTCIVDAGGADREAERRCLGRPRAPRR